MILDCVALERRLDRMLAESQGRQEQLNQQLSHALSSSLTNRMDRVLREEMKKTVPPSKRSHHSINGLYFNHYKGLNYSHVLFYLLCPNH